MREALTLRGNLLPLPNLIQPINRYCENTKKHATQPNRLGPSFFVQSHAYIDIKQLRYLAVSPRPCSLCVNDTKVTGLPRALPVIILVQV